MCTLHPSAIGSVRSATHMCPPTPYPMSETKFLTPRCPWMKTWTLAKHVSIIFSHTIMTILYICNAAHVFHCNACSLPAYKVVMNFSLSIIISINLSEMLGVSSLTVLKIISTILNNLLLRSLFCHVNSGNPVMVSNYLVTFLGENCFPSPSCWIP